MSEARGRKVKTAIEAEWKAPGGKSGSSHAKQVPPRKKHYAHVAKKRENTLAQNYIPAHFYMHLCLDVM
ncbi:hypothetical protein AU387_08260 [Bacillus halotolerans]|nr:hypothetical protein AU387_08260 [Bacillus halotolerans]